MGLQKYRVDIEGGKQPNGGTPCYAQWMGGPTLALVRDCVIENLELEPRTVYVQGEADTWFSIPAACRFRGRTITGYLTMNESEYVFRAHSGQAEAHGLKARPQP
jgi:hypothetical protein